MDYLGNYSLIIARHVRHRNGRSRYYPIVPESLSFDAGQSCSIVEIVSRAARMVSRAVETATADPAVARRGSALALCKHDAG